MQVRLTEPALADLIAIQQFIGVENPAAASRVVVQLLAACDRLEYLPRRGRPGRVPGTVEFAAQHPYVIVYQVVADAVEVLRIWHGAQPR